MNDPTPCQSDPAPPRTPGKAGPFYPSRHEVARGGGVWALAGGQMFVYACLYYVFAALILPWQTDLGWDKAQFASGPTLALLLAAGLAPSAGRLVDRGFGPEALTFAPLLGAAGLSVLALSQGYWGYLSGWIVVGLACALGLYEICFAFLIRRLGGDARAAIVRVTLVAGFASTLAFPAGAMLSAEIGWRGALWVAVAALILLAMPLHWWGGQRIRRQTPPVPTSDNSAKPEAARAPRGRRLGGQEAGTGRAFRLLAGLFLLVGLNHWMMIAFLVPLFIELGAPRALAVVAAAVVGPAQVGGRLVLMAVETRVGNAAVSWLTLVGFVLAVVLLAAAALSPGLIFAYALVQGSAIGVMTILKPVLIAEIMGERDYGAVAGAIQRPSLVALALAPLVAGGLLERFHAPGLIGFSAVLSLGSLALMVALSRRHPR